MTAATRYVSRYIEPRTARVETLVSHEAWEQTSLLALGIEPYGKTKGGEHSRKSRPRKPAVDPRPKVQWDLLKETA